MKDMFRRMDVNGSGTISLVEFRKGLQRSGFHDHGGMHLSGLDRDTLKVSVKDTVRGIVQGEGSMGRAMREARSR